MRRVIAGVFACLFAFLFTVTAFSHGGRTDSSGGHKDNHNVSGLGPYHYHCGGHPSHLHTNGVCPYDGKDNSTIERENKKNGNNKYKGNSSGTSSKTSSKRFGENDIIAIILSLLSCSLLFVPLAYSWIKECLENSIARFRSKKK